MFPVETLCPLGCDTVAFQECDILEREDHSTPPYQWQMSQPNWWDDLGITPSHPWVAPELPLPDLTTPTLHTTKSQACYQGLALPHPFIKAASPSLRTGPLPDPPFYATRPLMRIGTPPRVQQFRGRLGYTIVKGLMSEGDCGPTWAKIEKIFEEGDEKVVGTFDHIFNVESTKA